jgi:D-3-phosphoglycerate dehydrogenase / 2-oxoglutarate reductase
MKVLLLENIHSGVSEYLTGYYGDNINIVNLPDSMTEEQLILELPKYNILGIRSKTHITANVLQHCQHLSAICCFCIGTNQVDLDACMEMNIPVFNSPYMNTRSVAELVMSLIITMARQIHIRNIEMHQQHWNKTSNNCHEVRGKTLGIIGYGHVGSQISILAEAFGMNVIFYDIAPVLPLGNSRKIDNMKDLLNQSDFVTIHVPLLEETNHLFGDTEFSYMKTGSYIINTSRGTVINLTSLKSYLDNGTIRGAALDVYPNEPTGNKCLWESPFQKYNNVVLTPHIGGATEEAQNQIGIDISQKIINFIDYGSTMGVVNMPEIVSNAKFKNGGSILVNFHENLPGYLSKINKIFDEYHINIDKQILSTYKNKGYLIVKIKKAINDNDNVKMSLMCKQIYELNNNSRSYLIK